MKSHSHAAISLTRIFVSVCVVRIAAGHCGKSTRINESRTRCSSTDLYSASLADAFLAALLERCVRKPAIAEQQRPAAVKMAATSASEICESGDQLRA